MQNVGLLKLAKPQTSPENFDKDVLDHRTIAQARRHAFTAIQSIRDPTIDAVLFVGADMLRESPALLAEF
jgi:hypothetical protein